MPSAKLKYKKRKLNKGFKFVPLKKSRNQELVEEIEGERKVNDENENLLEELLDDLNNIKSKRTLEYFIAENKEYINQLDATNKNFFLAQIERNFYK